MALLRKLFARKAMDGLSPVSERVFVFNSCMTIEALDEDTHKDYLSSTIIQLKGSNPYASLMVVNFAAAPSGISPVHSLLRQGAAAAVVTDYPSRYAGCPSLPLATIHAFLGSCVDWLVSGHQRNILLMHCDGANGAAWPALAFAMASLLVYIGEAAPEQMTLDAVYGRAPVEMLSAGSALDPRPSHLRYLQYVARLRDKGSLMGMKQDPFVLDCLILRAVPDFDGGGGCRPIVRVHGEPQPDASPVVLFSTPRIKQQFKKYKQEDSTVIKADIGCQIQGDVVIECIHVGDENHEDIMFRIMFNTSFLQSNMMVFTMDEIDLPWNCCREKLQEGFKIEMFFSKVELPDIDEYNDDVSDLGNADEFYDFDEILIDMDFHEWHSETSRQDHSQEGSETGASESASTSSEEKGEDDEIGASDSASNSSEEKGNISSDGDTELVHGADATRESIDPRLRETSFRASSKEKAEDDEIGASDGASNSSEEKGSISSDGVHGENVTRESKYPRLGETGFLLEVENTNGEKPTNGQENRRASEGFTHMSAEENRRASEGFTHVQEGSQGVTDSVSEGSHSNEKGYEALNPKPMRKSKQREAAVIPPVPAIRKKIRKTEIGSDVKKPAISNRVGSPRGAPAATSSSKSSTSQANTTPSPPKPYEIANRLKQGAAQARRTSSSFAPSPLGRGLNREDNKCSGSPLDKNKKPITHPSEKPRTGKTQKQEATTSSVVEAPRRTAGMKKSSSLPVISETATIASSGKIRTAGSLPGSKTSRPSSGFHIAAASLSPRAHKHGMSPPPSPGRSPLSGSKFHRGVPVAQPDMQQGTSAPVTLTRRASFGELSKSTASSRASDGHSLSPRTSKVIQNHPEGMKGSARSLSPLSPRLTKTQQSTKAAAAVTASSSKDNRSGAAPARPTRLSS